MLKKLIFGITMTAALGLSIVHTDSFAASLPDQSYNYNYWEDIVYTPAPYEPDYVVE